MTKQSNAKRICEKHGYPSEVEALLEEVCALIWEKVKGVRSIVLSGSVATGDLVYRKTAEGLSIFSDLDLLTFADTPSVTEDFSTRLLEIEDRFRTNLFHIDLSINPAKSLRRIVPSYQMAELRKVDSVLLGEDLRARFPVTADPRFSRQALILNLWKAILYWPDGNPDREECFQWTLARLILDVPLLVFSELQSVIPGHFARAQALGALSAKDHPLATLSIQSAVMRAATMRRAGTTDGVDLKSDFFKTLDAVLCYLGLDGLQAHTSLENRANRLNAIFPRRSLRRRGGELRTALRCSGSIAERWDWWLRRKEAWAGVAVMEMIAVLSEENPQAALGRVEESLTKLGGQTARFSSADLRSKQFRVIYWDGLTRLYPSMRSNTAFVLRAGGNLQ